MGFLKEWLLSLQLVKEISHLYKSNLHSSDSTTQVGSMVKHLANNYFEFLLWPGSQPTFMLISKTSWSLQYSFFQMMLRRQLKLLESRCEWSVQRLKSTWLISLPIFSSESRFWNASIKILLVKGIIWKTPYGRGRITLHWRSSQYILSRSKLYM
jgi:hypothetical protein